MPSKEVQMTQAFVSKEFTLDCFSDARNSKVTITRAFSSRNLTGFIDYRKERDSETTFHSREILKNCSVRSFE